MSSALRLMNNYIESNQIMPAINSYHRYEFNSTSKVNKIQTIECTYMRVTKWYLSIWEMIIIERGVHCFFFFFLFVLCLLSVFVCLFVCLFLFFVSVSPRTEAYCFFIIKKQTKKQTKQNKICIEYLNNCRDSLDIQRDTQLRGDLVEQRVALRLMSYCLESNQIMLVLLNRETLVEIV